MRESKASKEEVVLLVEQVKEGCEAEAAEEKCR